MELLEESGLPPLCATFAMKDDMDQSLGELLAEAVKVLSNALLLQQEVSPAQIAPGIVSASVGGRRMPAEHVCTLCMSQATLHCMQHCVQTVYVFAAAQFRFDWIATEPARAQEP